MADLKTTQFNPMTAAQSDASVIIPTVKVSDTTMDPTGTDRSMTRAEFAAMIAAIIGTTTTEGVQDIVGAMLAPGTGIALSYNDPSGVVTITNTGTAASSTKINVKDHGVIGNGSTPDQSALNTLFAGPGGGKTVVFPAGTYPCNNVTIGVAGTRVEFEAGAKLLGNGANPVLNVSGNDVVLKDVVIDGNAQNQPGIYTTGQRFRYNSVKITNTGTATSHTMIAANKGQMFDCEFEKYLSYSVNDISMLACRHSGGIIHAILDAVDPESMDRWILDDCRFEYTGGTNPDCFVVLQAQDVVLGVPINNWAERLLIGNCHFTVKASAGLISGCLSLPAWRGGSVHDNTFTLERSTGGQNVELAKCEFLTFSKNDINNGGFANGGGVITHDNWGCQVIHNTLRGGASITVRSDAARGEIGTIVESNQTWLPAGPTNFGGGGLAVVADNAGLLKDIVVRGNTVINLGTNGGYGLAIWNYGGSTVTGLEINDNTVDNFDVNFYFENGMTALIENNKSKNPGSFHRINGGSGTLNLTVRNNSWNFVTSIPQNAPNWLSRLGEIFWHTDAAVGEPVGWYTTAVTGGQNGGPVYTPMDIL